MIDDTLLQKISIILQKIKNNLLPFGGIKVIFVGDFCQLSPVSGNYCFTSEIWKELDLKTIHLTKLIRQQDDEIFQKILQEVRFGKCSKTTFKILEKLKDTELKISTKLYSLNNQVDAINKYELAKLLKNEAKIIHCAPLIITQFEQGLSLEHTQEFNVDIDIFRYHAYSSDKTIKINDYEIDVMKGAYVMVTRNINFETGLINGTTGTIISLNPTSICISDKNNKTYTIYYHKDINENNNTYTKFMPIKLAYAISIHKSQGSTLDSVEVDGSSFIFAPGQLYTALSRAKNMSSIRLLNLDKYSFICYKSVKEFYQNLSEKL